MKGGSGERGVLTRISPFDRMHIAPCVNNASSTIKHTDRAALRLSIERVMEAFRIN